MQQMSMALFDETSEPSFLLRVLRGFTAQPETREE
jgi:hypothetical protein